MWLLFVMPNLGSFVSFILPSTELITFGNSSSFPSTSISLIAQLVKNLPAMQKTPVQFLGQEDPLEKGKATHSSVLAWRIQTGVQSLEQQRVDRTERLSLSFHFHFPFYQFRGYMLHIYAFYDYSLAYIFNLLKAIINWHISATRKCRAYNTLTIIPLDG